MTGYTTRAPDGTALNIPASWYPQPPLIPNLPEERQPQRVTVAFLTQMAVLRLKDMAAVMGCMELAALVSVIEEAAVHGDLAAAIEASGEADMMKRSEG